MRIVDGPTIQLLRAANDLLFLNEAKQNFDQERKL